MSFTKPTASGRDYPTQVGRLVDIVEGPALRNFIRNGDFQIAQRGTSFAGITAEAYTLDGWKAGFAGTQTVTQQTFTVGQTDVPGNPRNFMRVARSVAAGSFNGVLLQPVEFPARLSGKTVTVSFYAKVSSGTKTLGVYLQNNGGITWAGDPSGQNVALTTTWTEFKLTFSLNAMTAVSASAALNLLIAENTPYSTFTLDIADVQLELGSEATYFERLGYGEQLRWNQRFAFSPIYADASSNLSFANAYPTDATNFYAVLELPVEMRALPSSVSISAAASFALGYPGSVALSSLIFSSANVRTRCLLSGATAGHTATQVYQLFRPGTTATLIVSAEL